MAEECTPDVASRSNEFLGPLREKGNSKSADCIWCKDPRAAKKYYVVGRLTIHVYTCTCT